MKEGWLCPRCKKVNAPWVSQCTCTEYHEKITTNTPIVGDPPFTYPNVPNWTPYYDTVFRKEIMSRKNIRQNYFNYWSLQL